MRLMGEVAIITGAGRGIGQATALKFAKEGALVAVCDIDEKSAIDTARMVEGLGGKALSFRVDVTDKLSIQDMVLTVHERWGKIVAAFIKRRSAVQEAELDQFCRTSGLANFKRPRRYIFVNEIPKSPVGKLLRRKLVAGEFEAEGNAEAKGNAA